MFDWGQNCIRNADIHTEVSWQSAESSLGVSWDHNTAKHFYTFYVVFGDQSSNNTVEFLRTPIVLPYWQTYFYIHMK
jgi:hypothetical protein